MKKQLQKILLVGGISAMALVNAKAQTTSTFESLSLPGTAWNGSAQPLGTIFTEGNAIFQNYYDTAYGGYWSSGWAYSNIADSTTAGYQNMYAARPASGYNSSKKYLIGKDNAIIKLSGADLGKAVKGFYVTNGTYAFTSMKNGDNFSKKFGGNSGNDADWFKLTVRKYSGGVLTNDSVEFYLADYRFADNSKDYIVNTWQWVDLSSLGNVDSLKFFLSSSDVGQWGINTPAFFCMDNFTSQTALTFESLVLPGKVWNGSSHAMGTSFTNGNAIFPNLYDTSYGGYWSEGWAYSNMTDSTTAGYVNMYAARPASGYAGSEKYLIGKDNAKIKLSGAALGKVVSGCYITNGTYAALSMKNGDGFAKKFGGNSGNDADWFKLTVRKYTGGTIANDSVEFYLADYRFADNSKDYIVNDWQWLDLTPLGNADSLQFILSSSDMGAYGMNTPGFFCMDNFTTADSPLAVDEMNYNDSRVTVFPNPSSNYINVNLRDSKLPEAMISIVDVMGRLLYSEPSQSAASQISIAHLPAGIYYLKITGNNYIETKAFIKY